MGGVGIASCRGGCDGYEQVLGKATGVAGRDGDLAGSVRIICAKVRI